MKVESIFSLRDYFSYYFAGLWWLACLLVLLLPDLQSIQLPDSLGKLGDSLAPSLNRRFSDHCPLLYWFYDDAAFRIADALLALALGRPAPSHFAQRRRLKTFFTPVVESGFALRVGPRSFRCCLQSIVWHRT